MNPTENNENITENPSKTEFENLKEEDMTIFAALDQIVEAVECKHLKMDAIDSLSGRKTLIIIAQRN